MQALIGCIVDGRARNGKCLTLLCSPGELCLTEHEANTGSADLQICGSQVRTAVSYFP